MGVKIAIGVVLYILVAVVASFCLWDWLSRGEPSVSSTIRNLVLSWGAPLAAGLAVWRSIVAQKQVEAAQAGLLSARHQRAVEMLGHDLVSIRLGGIRALTNLAFEYSDKQAKKEVQVLLKLYGSEPNLHADSPAGKRHEELLRRAATESSEVLEQGKPADRWWRRLLLWLKKFFGKTR